MARATQTRESNRDCSKQAAVGDCSRNWKFPLFGTLNVGAFTIGHYLDDPLFVGVGGAVAVRRVKRGPGCVTAWSRVGCTQVYWDTGPLRSAADLKHATNRACTNSHLLDHLQALYIFQWFSIIFWCFRGLLNTLVSNILFNIGSQATSMQYQTNPFLISEA